MKRIFQTLDRWSWVVLILCAPFMLFPSAQRSLVLLIIPGLWLVSFLVGSRPVLPTPLNVCLLVLGTMLLVSLYATYNIALSLPKISGMILGIAVFLAIVRQSRQPMGWLGGLLVFLVSGAGVAAAGLLGTHWAIEKFGFLGSFTQSLPLVLRGLPGASEGFHPNEVAGALLWVLPIFLILSVTGLMGRTEFPWSGNRVIKLVVNAILFCLTALIGIVFVLTQSRGGFLALAVTMFFILGVSLPKRSRLIFLGASAALAGAAGIWLAASPGGQMLLVEEINRFAVPGSALSLNSMQFRMEIWSKAISGIQDFPLTGMGMNTFRQVVQGLYPLFYAGPGVDIGHAHNEFLQAGLDLGIPGLVAFMGIHVLMFWMAVQTWRLAQRENQREPSPSRAGGISSGSIQWLGLGLIGGFTAHFLYGLTDAVALGAKPGILFWMVLGLTTGLYILVQTPHDLPTMGNHESSIIPSMGKGGFS